MTKTKFEQVLPGIIALSSLKKETSFEKIIESAVTYYGKSKDQELIENADSFFEFIESFYTQNKWNWTENKAKVYFNALTKFSVCVLFKGSLQYMKVEYREQVKYVACKYLDGKVKKFSDVSQKAREERKRLNKIPKYIELNERYDEILAGEGTYIQKFKNLNNLEISQKLSEYNQELFIYLDNEKDILDEIGEYCYGSSREYVKNGSSVFIEKFLSDYAYARGYEKLDGEYGKHWRITSEEQQ